MCYGGAHGKTIGAVAIADSGYEGCVEGPHAMAEPLLLMRAESSDGFILRERLKPVSIGSIDKALVETTYDLSKGSTIRPQADGIAVSFLLAKGDMAADTGHADYRIDKAEDLLDLFNGYYLAKVGFLHLPGNDAAYDTLYEP